ncbi:MAG: hypothetical protein IT452_12975 [Planctomycetia bacterium]|nr:hypothetical protein [Planctomycetia bacterium]
MGEFERKLFGEAGSLEPAPKSDGLHDNRAVSLGGRVTWQYAWDLAAGGGGRDYVARALLARGLDPDVVKSLVVEVYAARKADYRARGRRSMIVGALLLAGAVVLAVFTLRAYSGPEYDPVEVGALVFRRATLPAAIGLGFLLWGIGLVRRAAKL